VILCSGAKADSTFPRKCSMETPVRHSRGTHPCSTLPRPAA